MTRTAAIFLSMFGPILPVILLGAVFGLYDNEPPAWVAVAAVVALIASALTMRLYFAMWYVRDKGRSRALGLLALFGLLGWIFLLVTEDRKDAAPQLLVNAASPCGAS